MTVACGVPPGTHLYVSEGSSSSLLSQLSLQLKFGKKGILSELTDNSGVIFYPKPRGVIVCTYLSQGGTIRMRGTYHRYIVLSLELLPRTACDVPLVLLCTFADLTLICLSLKLPKAP